DPSRRAIPPAMMKATANDPIPRGPRMEPRRTTDGAPKPRTRPAGHPGMIRLACLLALSAVVWLPGLGGWERLSYHEAFVAQGAREMLDSGAWANPTIGGGPRRGEPPPPPGGVRAGGPAGRAGRAGRGAAPPPRGGA